MTPSTVCTAIVVYILLIILDSGTNTILSVFITTDTMAPHNSVFDSLLLQSSNIYTEKKASVLDSNACLPDWQVKNYIQSRQIVENEVA